MGNEDTDENEVLCSKEWTMIWNSTRPESEKSGPSKHDRGRRRDRPGEEGGVGGSRTSPLQPPLQ